MALINQDKLGNGTHRVHRASAYVLEVTRSILHRFPLRGRYRLGSVVSGIFVPKRKVALSHRLGGKMVFDFSNQHEVSMYFDFFAPELSRIMSRVLRPGDSFIDCGANIGYFSCMAATLVGHRGGQVVSIDANPYCIERIRDSKAVGHYANLHIIPCAVGDRDGQIEFNLANDRMYSSLANLNGLDFTSTKSTIVVPLRKLDDILRESSFECRRPVRLIKLDVEGAEIDVLRGAEDAINAKSLDYIYVEIHDKQIRLRGQDPQRLLSLLAARGFELVEQFGTNVFLYGAHA